MNAVLKVYDVTLTSAGPIFIGSGKEIAKKEYALLSKQHSVAVFDQLKLTELLSQKGLTERYIDFMLSGSKEDLGRWLYKNKVSQEEYIGLAKYQLSYGDSQIFVDSKLMDFVKDPYGNPYIPGSSIKGMIRTILLTNAIIQSDIRKYQDIIQRMEEKQRGKIWRNTYLSKERQKLESIFSMF